MRYLSRVVFLCVFLVGIVIFLLMTAVGTHVLIGVASVILPGKLHIKRVEGSFIKGISLADLTYSDDTLYTHIARMDFLWQLNRETWQQSVQFNNVHIKQLVVHDSNKKSVNNKVSPPDLIPSFPFNLDINPLTIDALQIGTINVVKSRLVASFTNKHWVIKTLETNYARQKISLQAQGDTQLPYSVSALLQVSPISSGKQGLEGEIKLIGNKDNYHWTGKLAGKTPFSMEGTLKNMQELHTRLSVGMNHLVIAGNLPFGLKFNASFPQPELLYPSLAGLTATINVVGSIHGPNSAELTMSVSPGTFQMSKDDSKSSIAFQGGKLSMALLSNALEATGLITINPDNIINLSLKLPGFDWHDPASKHQALDGNVLFQVNTLDFLQSFSPMMTHLQGQLSARLNLSGTMERPDLQGTLALKNASVAIPDVGLVIKSAQATLNTHNSHWDGVGSIIEQDGSELTLKGQGEFTPQVTGSVVLSGHDFSLIKTAEYTVNVSPNLIMTMKSRGLEVAGTIVVPKARLKPISFSNTLNLTDDAVFIDNTATPSALTQLKTNVSIKLGNDVSIETQGLNGFLEGGLQLQQSVDGSMSAVGELMVRDGRYHAYGQDLAINQGKLIFSGGTLTNPLISVRAVRTFKNASQFSGSDNLFDFSTQNLKTIDFVHNLTVGVDVIGSLNNPKIKLFSIPGSLSQADVLSLILLGKPANQASHSGGQLLMAAMSQMHLDSSTKGMQLASQLKDALGLDFDVKTTDKFQDTAFVMSKSLTKRLSISYNIGLFQENSSVLTIKYLLNKYFSVQVTTNNVGNGADILYTTP